MLSGTTVRPSRSVEICQVARVSSTTSVELIFARDPHSWSAEGAGWLLAASMTRTIPRITRTLIFVSGWPNLAKQPGTSRVHLSPIRSRLVPIASFEPSVSKEQSDLC